MVYYSNKIGADSFQGVCVYAKYAEGAAAAADREREEKMLAKTQQHLGQQRYHILSIVVENHWKQLEIRKRVLLRAKLRSSHLSTYPGMQ